MYHNITIKKLLSEEAHNFCVRKGTLYKTNIREIKALYRLINATIFNDSLVMPEIKLVRLRNAWAYCEGDECPFSKNKTRCTIYVHENWYRKNYLISTIAHEMVHQYQWDIISRKRQKQGLCSIMSHGPTFFQWRDAFNKHGLQLSISL